MAETAVALIGSDSLLGREVRDIVATRGPAFSLRLIADDEAQAGILTRVGDEPALSEQLTSESVAGRPRRHPRRRRCKQRQSPRPRPGRPPSSISPEPPKSAPTPACAPPWWKPEDPDEGGGLIHVIAHPAAIALALFLRRLQANEPLRRAVIQVLVPASEHGATGVEELQQQTVSLLSFKSLPQGRLRCAGCSFNLLARYGERGAGPARRNPSCASNAIWPPCSPSPATERTRPCRRCA